MRRTRFAWSAVALAVAAPGRAQTIAFVNANVVDVRAGTIRPRQTVLVRGDRIEQIGPSDSVALPPDTRRIEPANGFLVPGLADMHTHFARPEEFPVFLAYGVTLVQYLNATSEMLDWRDSTERRRLPGPEIHVCLGPVSDIATSDGARTVMANAVADGFDCVKPYDRLSDDAFRTLASEGRRLGVRTVAHIPRNLTWEQMLIARPNAVAHAEEFLYSPIETAAAIDSILTGMRAGNISLITTFTAYDVITRQVVELPELLAQPSLTYYSPVHRREWAPGRNHYARDFSVASIPDLRRRLVFQRALVRRLDSAGVRILAGTDVGNPLVLPGSSLHDELDQLVVAGLSPAAALRAATIAPAEFLGRDREIGSIETGKRADLVLVYGNPLRDISTLRLIGGVMLRGQWFPRDSLRRMLRHVQSTFQREQQFLDDVDRHGVTAALATAERSRYVPDTRALNELAYQLWRVQTDSASAGVLFRANRRLHPTDWIALGSLGDWLAASGDTIRAIEATERALRVRPRDRDLIEQLAGLRSPAVRRR